MRRLALGIVGALTVTMSACGGSGPTGPSTPSITTPPSTSTPPTTPAPTELWSVSGRVVATSTGRAAGAVRVTSDLGPSTISDAAGAFRLGSDENPPFTPHKFTTSHPDYMPREVYLNWQRGLRDNVTIDLISLAAPFNVAFYRQLVRRGLEQPNDLLAIRRWTSNPSFYVRNVDQTGRAIEPEVMALVLATIPRAVSDWTSGRLGVAQLEAGAQTRPETHGWIVVNITRDYASDFCGQALVGSNPGRITLVDDRCNCGSVKIPGDVVVHEVGHALGFTHVSDRNAVMYPQAGGGCPNGTLTAAERFHAALAYQRAPGNLDPDRDPSSAGYAAPAESSPPILETCFTRGRS
jgi:hypothetical protein